VRARGLTAARVLANSNPRAGALGGLEFTFVAPTAVELSAAGFFYGNASDLRLALALPCAFALEVPLFLKFM